MVRRILILLATSAIFTSVQADVGMGTDIFSRGQFHTSATGAFGSAFNHDYIVGGLGLGYMLIDGLELGLNGEAWFGEKPKIYKVSPGVRYIFPTFGSVKPYVGAFYNRTYFEGSIRDLDSVGGRAGLYSRVGEHTYAGIGVVHEKYLNCTETIYSSCSSTYPEFNVYFWF